MKISIIVPIYNTEKYLKQCIQSVLEQTFKDYEVILINDGSTDKSLEIAQKYCDNYENIRLINQKNSGQSAARNRGIKEAKGEYIYFLDADDAIDRSLFEICYKTIKDNNLEMVMFGYKYICEDGIDEHFNNKEIINNSIPNNKIFEGKELFKRDIYVKDTLAVLWSQLYKKEFLVQNNLFLEENIIYEDVEFIPRLLMLCKRMMYIDKPLYIYRRRTGSTTTALEFNYKYINSINKVLDKTIELISKLDTKDDNLTNSFRKYLNHTFKILVSYLNRLEFKEDNLLKDKIKILIGDYFNRYLDVSGEKPIKEDYHFFCEQITRFGEFGIEIYEHVKNKYCNTLERKEFIYKIKTPLDNANYVRDMTLSKLKLYDAKRSIGIYGISFHTECLINYYKKNIGEIIGTIYLIDSFKGKKNEIVNGIKVINIEDIKNYRLDCILISSYNSEKQLIENAKLYTNNVPIYSFYENNDILLFG